MKKSKFFILGLVVSLLAGCGPSSTPTTIPPATDPTTVPTISEPTTEPSVSTQPSVEIKDFVIETNLIKLGLTQTEQINLNETGVTFKSSNDNIATVSEDGVVTAVNEGEATITLSKEGFNDAYVDVIVSNISLWKGDYYTNTHKISINGMNITVNDVEASSVKYSKENEEDSTLKDKVSFKVEDISYELSFTNRYSNPSRFDAILKINDEATRINPSIEMFSGSYSADGSGDKYNINFVFGNYLNDNYNGFDVGVFSPSQATFITDAYYVESYMYYNGSSFVTAIDIIDYEGYGFGSFIVNYKDNKVSLFDLDWETDYFFYDPIIVTAPVQNANLEKLNYKFTNNSFTYMDDKNIAHRYNYEMSYSEEEKSEIITLTGKNNSSDVKVFIPTPYGLILKDGNNITEYAMPNFDLLALDKQFKAELFDFTVRKSSSDYEVTFDGTTYLKTEYVIENHKFGLKTMFNDKTVVLFPTISSVIIKLSIDNKVEYAIDKSYVYEAYGVPAVSYINGVATNLSLNKDLTVNYNGSKFDTKLIVDPVTFEIYISFESNNVGYIYTLLDVNTYTFVLLDSNTLTPTYFVSEEHVNYVLSNDFTSNGLDLIDFYLEGNVLKAKQENKFDSPITISFRYSSSNTPEILFNAGNIELSYYYETITIYEGNSFTSYISKDRYESIIGVYSFKGDYGVEKFYVEKGKFFADTLNGTTLDIKVEYNFSLMVLPFNNEKTTVLSFYVPGPDGTIVAQILLYFSGYGQLYCFNTPYVIEDIQTVHGIYTLDNNVIYVYENKMSINGETYDITSSEKDGDNINYVLGNNKILLTYSTVEKTLSLTESNVSSITQIGKYNKSDFDLDSLLGEYEASNGSQAVLEYSINPLNNVKDDYQLRVDGYTVYKEYQIRMYEGHIAIRFIGTGYSFYVYNDGSANVIAISNEGSNPPPPPPPPPSIG